MAEKKLVTDQVDLTEEMTAEMTAGAVVAETEEAAAVVETVAADKGEDAKLKIKN